MAPYTEWVETILGERLSAVAEPDRDRAARHGSEARFILVKVTTDRLRHLASLFETGRLRATVGRDFKLSEARLAHRLMEAGAPPGKLVLLPDPRNLPAGQVE